MLPKGTVTILFCCSSVEVLFCASLGAANKHQQDHFNCLWFVSFWVAKTSYPCGLGSTRADTKSRSRTTSISENSTLVESFKAEKRLNNRKWSNKWRCMSWRWEIFYTWPWKTITKKQGGFHSFFFMSIHYGKAYCKSDPSNQHGKFLRVQPCQRRITPSKWDVLVAKQNMTPEIIFPSIARKNSW